MITEKDIKPIPKYIVKRIKQLDKKQNPNYSSVRRFYSYLTKFNGELAKVTVAVKEHYKDWYIKQVAVHGIHNDKCFVKDMEFYLTVGYVVGWYEQGLQKHRKIYEYEDWCWADDKYYDPIAPVINPEFALTFKQYKYSQADKYKQHNIFKYLRTYEKYPATEYLVKLNLSHYATSVMLLKKLTKDKKFRKWVINNAEDFANHCYDIQAILYAYNHNKTLNVANSIFAYKRSIKNNTRFQEIEKLFDGNIEQFFHYIEKQNTNIASYLDYKDACEYLGLDMNEDKNRYPHNFKKWHDIRIDQYHTAKALKDEQERKELYTKFEQVANKYLALQRNLKDDFVVIIAKSPSELIHEGDFLHHCVGRMNYDQKFAREESLIFFVRNKSNQQTPFVTLEYSLKNHKVLQCYADHDTKPNDEVLNFVNKKWLPYANRKLRQLAI